MRVRYENTGAGLSSSLDGTRDGGDSLLGLVPGRVCLAGCFSTSLSLVVSGLVQQDFTPYRANERAQDKTI